MRSSRRYRMVAASAVAVLVGAVAPGAAAAAPPTHLCSELLAEHGGSGTVQGLHVVGDVVADVPACRFLFLRMVGDVTVRPGATFVASYSTVTGSIRRESATATSYVELWETVVAGDVVANGLSVQASSVHGDVVADATISGPGSPSDSSVRLLAARISGSVRAHAQVVDVRRGTVVGSVDAPASELVRLQQTVIGGDVHARGDSRLVVHDTSVRGTLHADAPRDVLVCRTGIGGDLVLQGVRMWTRVGEEGAASCRTTVAGSVHVLGNPSTVILGDVRVAGDLVCSDNTGSQGVVRRPALTVAGTRSPGCA